MGHATDSARRAQELWISYNLLDKLNGLEKLTNLRVVYMSNNLIAKWPEFDRFVSARARARARALTATRRPPPRPVLTGAVSAVPPC